MDRQCKKKSLRSLGIDFIDTHSLSMTKQVTASAAMTLAVLMSSLVGKDHTDSKGQ